MLVARSAVAALALATSVPCFADEKEACADAHIQGQTSRRDGKLTEARARFLECANESCPELVKKDCTTWAAELANAIPSVVIEVKDEEGRATADVTLVIDGEERSTRLDGRAIELDPGEHRVLLRLPSGKTAERRVMLHEGDRARRVTVAFPRREAPTPAPAREAAAPSALPFVFGGLAVVALGSFGTFALLGKQKQDELDECRPDCAQGDVDTMRTRYVVADVSLAVGAVATGLTLYFALSPNGKPREHAFVSPRVGARSAGFSAGLGF